jgi:hypothetical protein
MFLTILELTTRKGHARGWDLLWMESINLPVCYQDATYEVHVNGRVYCVLCRQATEGGRTFAPYWTVPNVGLGRQATDLLVGMVRVLTYLPVLRTANYSVLRTGTPTP